MNFFDPSGVLIDSVQIDGKTTGAARASIGLVTTFADVYRFWQFAEGLCDVPCDAVEGSELLRTDTGGQPPGQP